jgi:rod shape-determining protein MreB
LRIPQALSPVLYVRFDASSIVALNTRTLVEFRDKPLIAIRSAGMKSAVVVAVGAQSEMVREPNITVSNPFNHPRLVVYNFEHAEALFRYAIARIAGARVFLRPVIVVHPLRALEPALTDIEHRALTECALSAGGRAAVIHNGAQLSPEEAARLPVQPARRLTSGCS